MFFEKKCNRIFPSGEQVVRMNSFKASERTGKRFIREYLSFYETAAERHAAVIVGGQALDAELRSRLRYAAFGDRMIHLAEFARQLGSTTSLAGQVAASSGKVVRPILGSSQNAR